MPVTKKKQFVIIDQSGPGDAWVGCYDSLNVAKMHVTFEPDAVKRYLFILEMEEDEHIERPDAPAWVLDGKVWHQKTQQEVW